MMRSLNALPTFLLLALLSGAGLVGQERVTPFLGGGLALGTGDLADPSPIRTPPAPGWPPARSRSGGG